MPHAKGCGIFWYVGEITDKSIPEGIADLQCKSKKHRIYKKDEHLRSLEQHKGIQTQRREKTRLGARPYRETGGQGKRIDAQKKPGPGAEVELRRTLFPTAKIHDPHGADKTYRSPYADRRKVLGAFKTFPLENDIGNRIVQGDGRHKKEGIEQHGD